MLSKIYGKKKLPDRKNVRHMIVFVAQAMERESLTELLIEKMQPSWLRSRIHKCQYRLSLSIFISLFWSLSLGIVIGISSQLFHQQSIFKFLLGLTFGLMLGLFLIPLLFLIEFESQKINPLEFIPKMSYMLIFRLIKSSLAGSFLGLLIGLFYKSIFQSKYPSELLLATITGTVVVLIYSWLILQKDLDKINRTSANQGIKNTVMNMFLIKVVSIVLVLGEMIILTMFSFVYLEVHHT